jgi:hypothetical protein
MTKELTCYPYPCFNTSAFAADQFYIAKDQTTSKCKIVKAKPKNDKLILVGTESYATKDAAKAARKAADECKKST